MVLQLTANNIYGIILDKGERYMRNLTIKREKSFVGSLSKANIYIKDEEQGNVKICGVNCRKLGAVKNGQEATFTIDNFSKEIYVIQDKISKNFCCELYELPAGDSDVVLYGKNEYNPLHGNGFRFYNNDTPRVLANKKKNSKKMAIFLAICVCVGLIVGFLSGSGLLDSLFLQDETFNCKDMSITLTSEFYEEADSYYDGIYYDSDVCCYVLKEKYSDLSEVMENNTLEEYMKLIIDSNEYEEIFNTNTISAPYSFEASFRDEETGDDLYGYYYFYKNGDDYWFVQFVIYLEDKDELKDTVAKYAKSVKFNINQNAALSNRDNALV